MARASMTGKCLIAAGASPPAAAVAVAVADVSVLFKPRVQEVSLAT